MLFNLENDNDIIYNARDCSITYIGRQWNELPSVTSLPIGYHEIGRVGSYHFYLPLDVRSIVSTQYDGYFIRGEANVCDKTGL